MKKIRAISVTTLVIVYGICSHNQDHSELKLRGAAFIPQSDLFRDIYGTAGGCVELEYAYHIKSYLNLWGNFDWFSKKGRSLGTCDPTKIKIAYFSFGLSCVHEINACNLFSIGIGPSIAGIWLTNKSHPCEKVSKASGGLVIKTNYNNYFSENVTIELFADYVYQPVHFRPRHTQVGGLRLGAGLGYTF